MSDIIEAVALALFKQFARAGNIMETDWKVTAEAILAAVTPLIRAQALEEAAVIIENDDGYSSSTAELAASIRALKEQP